MLISPGKKLHNEFNVKFVFDIEYFKILVIFFMHYKIKRICRVS